VERRKEKRYIQVHNAARLLHRLSSLLPTLGVPVFLQTLEDELEGALLPLGGELGDTFLFLLSHQITLSRRRSVHAEEKSRFFLLSLNI
jgi:hypothetical protein